MSSLRKPFGIFVTILLLLLSMTTTVQSQRQSCNICKSGDEIRNKDGIIVAWHFFGLRYLQTCDWLDKKYTLGVWPDRCRRAHENKNWQRICGCNK
jgi:hypothetical protein